jgi:hypothetical protein
MSKFGFLITKSFTPIKNTWLYQIKNSKISIIINRQLVSSLSFDNGLEKLYDIFEASNYINSKEELKINRPLYNALLLEYYDDLNLNLI